MITLVLPEKLHLKLPEQDARKLYNFLADMGAEKIAISDDWGMDVVAFRTRSGDVVLYVPSREGHRFVEIDTFEEIMLRDLLSFALNRREAVV